MELKIWTVECWVETGKNMQEHPTYVDRAGLHLRSSSQQGLDRRRARSRKRFRFRFRFSECVAVVVWVRIRSMDAWHLPLPVPGSMAQYVLVVDPPIVITYTTKLKLQEVRLIYFILSPVALLYYTCKRRSY
jgi:hypothetical protein